VFSARSRSVRWYVAVVVAAVAAAVPAVALAWSTYYVEHQDFGPGGIGLSAFNSGINYNRMIFSKYAGDPYQEVGQTTLCDSSYSCYGYVSDDDGAVYDYRSISYGRAKCHAAVLNPNHIYVNHCYTQN